MSRKKPPPRIVVQRSRNNPNRRLIAALPDVSSRSALSAQVSYGAYSKHKLRPMAYKLSAYAAHDEERTYCDAHAQFGVSNISQIPALLVRGVMLGLWSVQLNSDGAPRLLWTLDDRGWIFELRITNPGQAQYHGYPVLPGDAFARHVLTRARDVVFNQAAYPLTQDPGVVSAITAAESFYR